MFLYTACGELVAILFKAVGPSRTFQKIIIRYDKILGVLGLPNWVFRRMLEVTCLTVIAKEGICPTVIPILIRYQTHHVYSLCQQYPFAQAPANKFLLTLQAPRSTSVPCMHLHRCQPSYPVWFLKSGARISSSLTPAVTLGVFHIIGSW